MLLPRKVPAIPVSAPLKLCQFAVDSAVPHGQLMCDPPGLMHLSDFPHLTRAEIVSIRHDVEG